MVLNVTHHEVLDCIAAAAFQKFHLDDGCGAAASFRVIISLFTLEILSLLWMLSTSSSLSLTPLTYLAGRLGMSLLLLVLALFSCRSCESSAVFYSVDPCVVDLAAAFGQVFCLFFNKFEEFVDVIFTSFPWSSNRSVGPVF